MSSLVLPNLRLGVDLRPKRQMRNNNCSGGADEGAGGRREEGEWSRMNGAAKQWHLVSRCQPAESGPVLAAVGNVGKWEEPVAGQGRSKKQSRKNQQETIGCRTVRYERPHSSESGSPACRTYPYLKLVLLLQRRNDPVLMISCGLMTLEGFQFPKSQVQVVLGSCCYCGRGTEVLGSCPLKAGICGAGARLLVLQGKGSSCRRRWLRPAGLTHSPSTNIERLVR